MKTLADFPEVKAALYCGQCHRKLTENCRVETWRDYLCVLCRICGYSTSFKREEVA